MSVQIGPVAVSDKVFFIVLGSTLLLLVGGVWYVKYKAGKAVEAVNPFNNKNVISTGVNSALAPALGKNELTGKDNTIGSALYFGVDKIKAIF